MGYPVFPNVPDLPGVPALPRFPTSAAQLSQLAGQIVGTKLSISNVAGAALYAGAALNAPGLITGTQIVQQLTGAAGQIGDYLINADQNFSGAINSTFTPPDTSEPTALQSDSTTTGAPPGPQWGIFDQSGKSVVIADNVVSFEFKQDWSISDFPVQQGAFETYDKVYVPYDVRLQFSAGGSPSNRQALIDSINAIAGSLDLYDVLTPEQPYTSVNVVHQDYIRTAVNGAAIIKANVWLLQVNVDGSATFSNPKNPTAKAAVNDGTVQPSAASSQQQANLPMLT